MTQTRAIVIIFRGEEITEEQVGTVAAYLAQYGNQVTDVHTFDCQEIGKLMLHECKIADNGQERDMGRRTPEDQAAIFIGTTMKNELGADYTSGMFVASLIDRIRRAKKYPTKTVNKEFMNALFILSQEDLNISKTILEKFNLDADRIALIKETYNFFAKF